MSGIGSVFSWKWVLILNGNLWSHNLIWLWALRILFKVYHFWIYKHDNVDFISNVDSKAVDIWVRCAFNDVSYNYNMGPNLRKETGKEGSCRKIGRFSPKHDDRYFFDFGLTLFWHKFRWLYHGIFTFQIPFRVTINGGVLTCHWWTKISHVLNFILGFSLYFSSLLRHIRHIIITTGY